MNMFIVIGRLVKDSELKTLENGKKLTNFTLAVDGGKDKNGEKITDFIPFTLWDRAAETFCSFYKKGDMIKLLGREGMRKKEKDGKIEYLHEPVVTQHKLLCHSKQNEEENTATRVEELNK